jgi:hypothetical protein
MEIGQRRRSAKAEVAARRVGRKQRIDVSKPATIHVAHRRFAAASSAPKL